jgi:hypothetical protein
MKYKKFKLKAGKETQWRAWCAFLIAHESEVKETLREEAVTREACWLADGFVYYGMEGLCLPASDKELNRNHRQSVRECLEPTKENVSAVPEGAEKLFDFSTL